MEIFQGAQKTADSIQDADSQSSALEHIAEAQAKAGDIAGALKTIDLIRSAAGKKIMGPTFLAKGQAEAGNIKEALKTADSIQDAQCKGMALSRIVDIQARAHDIAGAQKTADLIHVAFPQSAARVAIACAQTKAGDIAGAQRTADLIQDPEEKTIAQTDIADAQVRAGNIAAAQETLVRALKTAEFIWSEDRENLVERAIARVQAKVGAANTTNPTRLSTPDNHSAILKVSDFLRKLDGAVFAGDCALNTDPFLDLASYLKSLPPSDEPQKVFETLRDIAKKIVTAQNVIDRMLKQQAKEQAAKSVVKALDDDFEVKKSGDTAHVPPPPPPK